MVTTSLDLRKDLLALMLYRPIIAALLSITMLVNTWMDGWIDSYNTVNICALDLIKALDKVNHHALFI